MRKPDEKPAPVVDDEPSSECEDCQNKDDEIRELATEKDDLDDEITGLKQELKTKRKRCTSLEKKLRTYEEEINKIRKKIDGASKLHGEVGEFIEEVYDVLADLHGLTQLTVPISETPLAGLSGATVTPTGGPSPLPPTDTSAGK